MLAATPGSAFGKTTAAAVARGGAKVEDVSSTESQLLFFLHLPNDKLLNLNNFK